VVIPFKLEGAKSRLSPILTQEERMSFAISMLRDVLASTTKYGCPTILARSPDVQACRISDLLAQLSFREVRTPLDLNDALNCVIEKAAGDGWHSDLLIVMSDLALIKESDILGMVSAIGDVVLSPGRGGGTNLILIRDPSFRTQYTGHSFSKHLAAASAMGLQVGEYSSFRTAFDMDEPDDLAEILIHGDGESRRFLLSKGFSLSNESGRASCRRVSVDG
jgi:2-phospho-L-lactate guanylyltransferase